MRFLFLLCLLFSVKVNSQTLSFQPLVNSLYDNIIKSEKFYFKASYQKNAQIVSFSPILDSSYSYSLKSVNEFYSSYFVPYMRIESFKSDISKSLSTILSLSSQTLLNEMITTQCTTIQTILLKNIVDSWKYIISQQKRVSSEYLSLGDTYNSTATLSPYPNSFKPTQTRNSSSNENLAIIRDKLDDIITKIDKINILIGITSFEQLIDFKDEVVRRELLLKIQSASSEFLELDKLIKTI